MYQERKSKRLEKKQKRGVYSRQLAREKRSVAGNGNGKQFERQAKGENGRQWERETRSAAGKGNDKHFERQAKGEDGRHGKGDKEYGRNREW
jgi:hypothetical protein